MENHAIIAGALLGFSVLILFIIVSDIPLTAANVAVGLAVLNGACWLLLRLLCRPAYNLSIQIPMKNDGHWLWRGGELIYRELTHDDATCPIPPECLVRVDDRQIIIDNDSTSGRILVFYYFPSCLAFSSIGHSYQTLLFRQKITAPHCFLQKWALYWHGEWPMPC